jgi:(p)ppGpp synthase/HD superfamily hydrolase
MLNKAIEIAAKAHDGQLDKCGEPYILHPLRVMLTRKTEIERVCAVMHDVIEDSFITIEDLRSEGFSEEVLSILDCLTKRVMEEYDDYISRVLTNDIACQIKLADLNDNMDPDRIKCCTEKDMLRIEKYKKAKRRILDYLYGN